MCIRDRLLDDFVAHRHVSQELQALSAHDAYWRTMLGGVKVWGSLVSRKVVEGDQVDFERFLDTGEYTDAEETVKAMILLQSFFITDTGYIGIGPPNIRLNDVAWIVRGSNVPLILRPRPDFLENKFVGDAFVHGVMDGELAESRSHDFAPLTLV